MGVLWFEAGQLADHLHALVGYMVGVAGWLQEICDLLSGSGRHTSALIYRIEPLSRRRLPSTRIFEFQSPYARPI